MNRLPLELIYIVGYKIRGKYLYDYKQITHFILDLNITDLYIEIVKDNTSKITLYKKKKQSINDECAVEWKDGSKHWYKYDKRHRIDGPAIEWTSGTKEWYQNGQIHRINGPAIEYSDGNKEWWINGQRTQ
jgi:hypothetical protein